MTRPGSTNTHAAVSAPLCQPTVEWPTRNNGRATIRHRVVALPATVTSMRRPPATATMRKPTATVASRSRAMTAITTGTAPTTMMEMAALTSRRRSASGSSTLPSVETCPRRRARNPSTQSVAPRAARSTAAANQSPR